MQPHLILASGSSVRAALLTNAGLRIAVQPAAVDEAAIVAALQAEGAAADEIADAVAGAKAQKASGRNPGQLVLGCDQVLAAGGTILRKAATVHEAATQLGGLSGNRHELYSAAVICLDGQPIWRFTGHVRLTMRILSDAFVADYLDRNWDELRHCVGCYQFEREGVRLFRHIEGDYFHILGLPLMEVLDFLTIRGVLTI